MFKIIKIVESEDVGFESNDCFDIHIQRESDGKVVVCDRVLIWDEDQQSLEDMFMLVENGEW